MNASLTGEAQKAARELAEIWQNSPNDQLWTLMELSSYGQISISMLKSLHSDKTYDVSRAILFELRDCGLLFIRPGSNGNLEVQLKQSLMLAVEQNFEIPIPSHKGNTAIGMLFQGDVTFGDNAVLQNAASNTGTINQSFQLLADHLTSVLRDEFLKTQVELKAAIDDLRTAVEADQQSKLGKVISELGNCLQHGANAAAVVVALNAAAPFLQRILGG